MNTTTFTIVDLYDTSEDYNLDLAVTEYFPSGMVFYSYTVSRPYAESISGATVQEVTIDEILAEINRDRSDEWLDYDRDDWEVGMYEWTTWRLVLD